MVPGCGEGIAVGSAIARGGGAGVSDPARASSIWGVGVLRGLGVSSFTADFDFAVFVVLLEAFLPSDLVFPVFGLGVGVCRCFPFGVGDFFGFGVDAERVPVSSD